MVAEVIQLADYRLLRRQAPHQPPAAPSAATDSGSRFVFWSGGSGKRYVHTVYNLFNCPELPSGNYVLVRCEAGERRAVLAIGRLTHASPTLNLAEIRHRAAQVGANEVHVHLLADDPLQSKAVETDLRSGQFRRSATASGSPTAH